jgi:hypothetical protein
MTQTGDSSIRRTPSNPRASKSDTPSALTEGTPGLRDRRGGRNCLSVV